jgi:hypothetical protein
MWSPHTLNQKNIEIILDFKKNGRRKINIFLVDTGDSQEIYNDILEVNFNGKRLDYVGKLLDIEMAETWFKTLKPGKNHISRFLLDEYYDFGDSSEGKLKVIFERYNNIIPEKQRKASFELKVRK